MKEYEPDYIQIPYPIYKDSRLESADRVLYGIIYCFEHMRDGKCFASNVALAASAGISPRSIPNALTKLEKLGYITRVFKDEGKRHRIEIKTHISYKNMARPDTRMGESRYARGRNPDTRVGEQSITKSNKKTIAAKPQRAEFKWRETRQKWFDGKDEAFQLIAYFFDKKNLWTKYDTQDKVRAVAKRHLRSARRIVAAGWSQAEVEKAIGKIPEKLRDEWTLDTTEKYLTK